MSELFQLFLTVCGYIILSIPYLLGGFLIAAAGAVIYATGVTLHMIWHLYRDDTGSE